MAVAYKVSEQRRSIKEELLLLKKKKLEGLNFWLTNNLYNII